MGAHVVLKDNRCTNLVNQSLILPSLLAQSAVNHGLMGQYGSETLIIIVNGNLRHRLTPTIDKLLYTSQVLTGLAIGLAGFTNDNTLNRFTSDILRQIVKQL